MYSPSGKRLQLKLASLSRSIRALRSILTCAISLRRRAPGERQKISSRGATKTESGWKLQGQNGGEWSGKILVGADGANSAIAKKLAGPLLRVGHGSRLRVPGAFAGAARRAYGCRISPEVGRLRLGVSSPGSHFIWHCSTQEAFDHDALDALLWQFMIGYYRQREDAKAKIWQPSGEEENARRIRTLLENSAERYAARIPGLADHAWDKRRACGPGWALLGDAAGFADPVTGEGIYYALRSAELFADVFLEGNVKRMRGAGAKILAENCAGHRRCDGAFMETSGARRSRRE